MIVRWTQLALQDLQAISTHIEQRRNLESANKVCRLIYDTVQVLRRFPERGKIGIEQNTREIVVLRSPYIVAYRLIHLEVVEVLRIWHGAQERQS